jgi:hypothetical protein
MKRDEKNNSKVPPAKMDSILQNIELKNQGKHKEKTKETPSHCADLP